MEETNTQRTGLDVSKHIASLRRTAPVNAEGHVQAPAIATMIGLLPEQVDEFMERGSVNVSRSITMKKWQAICDAAEFNKTNCITSPFGIIGHDVCALHGIAAPKSDTDKAFYEVKMHATANAPKFRREKSANGPILVCLDVRLDYAGMLHGDLWPAGLKPPGGGRVQTPFHRSRA